MLLVEAYAGLSHLRVNELLQRHSRHRIDVVQADRDHWKQLALLGHVQLAERVVHKAGDAPPDVMIFSGAFNVSTFLMLLPPSFRDVPSILYFHESQWSYPTLDEDTRPFLIQHLDAIMMAKEVWFNSRFHRDTFWTLATTAGMESGIRSLARNLHSSVAANMRVVYPPVDLDHLTGLAQLKCDRTHLTWNARWELDKRPECFVEAVEKLSASGVSAAVHILGTGGKDPDQILCQFEPGKFEFHIPGHLQERCDYEAELPNSGIVVSTADHEFFGVAMLESVLAGSIPVLPDALAYRETLPSAWFYRHGDVDDLVRILRSALDAGSALHGMHASDARRFLPEHTVPIWDQEISRVWHQRRSDR